MSVRTAFPTGTPRQRALHTALWRSIACDRLPDPAVLEAHAATMRWLAASHTYSDPFVRECASRAHASWLARAQEVSRKEGTDAVS